MEVVRAAQVRGERVVAVALRDLADITPHILHEPSREQARQCRQMLQDAFDAYKRSTDAKLKAMASTPALAETPASAPLTGDTAASDAPAKPGRTPTKTPTSTAVAAAGATDVRVIRAIAEDGSVVRVVDRRMVVP